MQNVPVAKVHNSSKNQIVYTLWPKPKCPKETDMSHVLMNTYMPLTDLRVQKLGKKESLVE